MTDTKMLSPEKLRELEARDSAEGVCTGQCCARFPISTTQVERLREDKGAGIQDGVRILAILQPLHGPRTPDEVSECTYFTCKVFDGEKCTEYDQRPRMCKHYPYDEACKYCGWKHPDLVEAQANRKSFSGEKSSLGDAVAALDQLSEQLDAQKDRV